MRAKSIFSLKEASFVMRAPPIKSECPPRYLVEECMTTSAPRSNGFWK